MHRPSGRRPHLPALVYERYGRIESYLLHGNCDDLHSAAVETVTQVTTALCLINRRRLTRDSFGGIRQSFDCELQPRNWAQPAVNLWQSGPPTAGAAAARELLIEYERFLAAQGMAVERYQSAVTPQIAGPLPA